MATVLVAVEAHPLEFVTVTLRITDPLAFAENVTPLVAAPAVIVPFVIVQA